MLTKRLVIPVAACFAINAVALPRCEQAEQPTPPAAPEAAPSLEDRIGLIKGSLVRSQAALKSYEWMETTTILLKGEEKSRTVKSCYYGAEGKVQKVTVEAPAAEPPKRGVRGRIVERKKEELADYVLEAVELVKSYVPPDPMRVQAAKDAGRASIQVVRPGERLSVTLGGYLKPEDSLSIHLDITTNQLLGLEIRTYLGPPLSPGTTPSDPVTITITESAFPDGTLYTETVELSAPSKKLKLVVENSGYRRVAGAFAPEATAIVAQTATAGPAVLPVASRGTARMEPQAPVPAADVARPRQQVNSAARSVAPRSVGQASGRGFNMPRSVRGGATLPQCTDARSGLIAGIDPGLDSMRFKLLNHD